MKKKLVLWGGTLLIAVAAITFSFARNSGAESYLLTQNVEALAQGEEHYSMECSNENVVNCKVIVCTPNGNYEETQDGNWKGWVLPFSGCGGEGKKSLTFDKEYDLQGHVYDTDVIGQYPYIGTIDSLVFVLLRNVSENFGRVYSIADGMKEIAAFGNLGRGPKEFSGIPELTSVYDDKFILHNLNRQEVVTMQIISDTGKVRVEEIERLKFDRHMINDLGVEARFISRIDEKHYVGIANKSNPDEIFSLYDNKMKPLGYFGSLPIEEKLNPNICLYGTIYTNNDRKGAFIHTIKDLPYIQYYEWEQGDDYPRKKWEDWFAESYYQVRDGRVMFSKTKSFGVTREAFLGNKYVYVLFLDVLLSKENFRNSETSAANIMLVYDHSGKKIAHLNLDHRLYRFCINRDETRIYGMTTTPEDRIVAFDLPKFDS